MSVFSFITAMSYDNNNVALGENVANPTNTAAVHLMSERRMHKP